MKVSRFTLSARFATAVGATAILAAAFAIPAQAEPASPNRLATVADMTTPWEPIDFVWVETQNPHGKEKILITIAATNLPTPGIVSSVTNSKGEFYNTDDYLIDPVLESATPSIGNSMLDFRWVPQQNAWHLTWNDKMSQVGVPGAYDVDLWYRNARAGAANEVSWDAPEKVFWSSSIATASVSGTIHFPNTAAPTKVDNWAGEEERMAGPYSLFPHHKGYDYAQSGNPDGSADLLFIYNNLDGTKRGILTHTSADGNVRMCEPTDIQLTDWRLDNTSVDRGIKSDPMVYPRSVAASCSGPNGTLSLHYSLTDEHMYPVIYDPIPGALGQSTMSDGHSQVPGSVATIQHYRNPAWAGNQTDWRLVQS